MCILYVTKDIGTLADIFVYEQVIVLFSFLFYCVDKTQMPAIVSMFKVYSACYWLQVQFYVADLTFSVFFSIFMPRKVLLLES